MIDKHKYQKTKSSFRTYYDRGDLPIKMEYLICGDKISWTVSTFPLIMFFFCLSHSIILCKFLYSIFFLCFLCSFVTVTMCMFVCMCVCRWISINWITAYICLYFSMAYQKQNIHTKLLHDKVLNVQFFHC